jgi:4,5-DOPA dioxygenase extradiol
MKSPVLFIGHGSPMNALGDNAYTQSLTQLRGSLPKPKAILAISAHWETEGTRILDMDPPPTIHDFGGFPKELFAIQYPAPGTPKLVKAVEKLIAVSRAKDWGLDHGTWAVLCHLYPEADIPVTQLSLNRGFSLREHLALGEKLKPLREQGILILASGNIVHNLRDINWRDAKAAFPWAIEFDETVREAVLERDIEALVSLESEASHQSVPTLEHYIPLMYVLGASDAGEKIEFPFAEIQNGSISMRSVKFS